MTMPSANGASAGGLAAEASQYLNPEMEEEWEMHGTSHYSNTEASSSPEAEWGTHEAQSGDPYTTPEMEDEWEGEATRVAHRAAPPRPHVAARPSPRPNATPRPGHGAPARPHAAPRPGHGAPPRQYMAPRPGHIAPPQGVATGPRHQPQVAQGIRQVTRHAQRVMPSVVYNVLGSAGPGMPPPALANPGGTVRRAGIWYRGDARWRPGVPRQTGTFPPHAGTSPRHAGMAPGAAWPPTAGTRPTFGGTRRMPLSAARRATVAGLLRQLSALFGEGESEAEALEAELFGANEFEGELAAHEIAHDAALTEVLAAEAAHAEDEGEAEALIGMSLPITIRIMGGQRALRPVLPTLVRGNARLVRSLHRGGPTGRQLLRAVPAIQRRTIASLRAAMRRGQTITPALAARVLAGQAARVLGTAPILGRSLIRNTAIRQSTVAPVGHPVAPRRTARI